MKKWCKELGCRSFASVIHEGHLCNEHYWQNKAKESDLMVKKLTAENGALRERIKDLIAGEVMHEPNWSNCNEV